MAFGRWAPRTYATTSRGVPLWFVDDLVGDLDGPLD